jgi:pimeloyl-ACP methyl ester carboxylesterase
MPQFQVKTAAGRISGRLSSGSRTPLLLIHGNSMSSAAFDDLIASPLGRSYRLIAVDLPGHGGSDNAANPESTYTLPGYADAMLDVLFALDAPGAAVLGWSLGGHIAFEMMSKSTSIAGAMAVSAPPVSPGPSALAGFNMTEDTVLYMTEELDEAAQRRLADVSAGAAAPRFAYQAVARTDGRARPIVVHTMLGGVGSDPAPLFHDGERPIALVVGEHETGISGDFMNGVRGPALWRGEVQTIKGAGHAPFLDAPSEFNALLLDFLRDVARSRRTAPASRPAAETKRRTA